MRSANPALSDKSMNRAIDAYSPGWARGGFTDSDAGPQGTTAPVRDDVMTMGGVITASGVLLALLFVAAGVGWSQVDQVTSTDPLNTSDLPSIPGWVFIVALVSFGFAILTIFKPMLARFTGPIYAIGMGVFLGAISAVYNSWSQGIVLQAVMLTAGVFLVMLFLYATRIIKVTKKLMIAVVAATVAVMFTYLATFIWMLVGGGTPAIYEAGPIGVGFSLLVVGIAAFNLLLDFAFIEHGVEVGLPKQMEWYAAFGLIVTLVWLYIEILRLLGKLRG